MKKIHISFILLFLFTSFLYAQEKKQVATVAFYNLENLFDTHISADFIDGTLSPNDSSFHISLPLEDAKKLGRTPYRGEWSDKALKGKKVLKYQILADDFTPESARNYTEEVYRKKLDKLSKVISEIGLKTTKTAPVVVGICEVENRKVVRDLINTDALKRYNYDLVHFNSYDSRGIDCALIYQKDRFKVTNSFKKEVIIYYGQEKREYTRDILVVSGLLDGEPFNFIVNHWPSRRGGETASLHKRIAAAKVLKELFEELSKENPLSKTIAMGDFNDDPVSPSIKKHLGTTYEIDKLNSGLLYNPMEEMYKKGLGTIAYKDAMSLFDQIIFTPNTINDTKGAKDDYKILTTRIFSPPYLIATEGAFKGYPLRSWNGDRYTDGYSDHFPVYTILYKKAK